MDKDEVIVAKTTCDACYFGVSDLCTLPKADLCATFRPQAGNMAAGYDKGSFS
ncbi:MAG: hypothetical protein Q7K29_09530 [Thermoleophilia bacterium]|nr:hypothetical protein [Thermoleophilia bacterium]